MMILLFFPVVFLENNKFFKSTKILYKILVNCIDDYNFNFKLDKYIYAKESL